MCRIMHLALLNLPHAWGSCRPTPWACPGPSGCHYVPQACQLHHLAWYCLQACWECTGSHCVDTKQYWFQYGLPRDTTYHWSPSGHWAVDHCFVAVTIQPIPYLLNSPPIKCISHQFREKDVVGDCVTGLTEVQIDDICSSSLVHWCSNSIVEGH